MNFLGTRFFGFMLSLSLVMFSVQAETTQGEDQSVRGQFSRGARSVLDAFQRARLQQVKTPLGTIELNVSEIADDLAQIISLSSTDKHLMRGATGFSIANRSLRTAVDLPVMLKYLLLDGGGGLAYLVLGDYLLDMVKIGDQAKQIKDADIIADYKKRLPEQEKARIKENVRNLAIKLVGKIFASSISRKFITTDNINLRLIYSSLIYTLIDAITPTVENIEDEITKKALQEKAELNQLLADQALKIETDQGNQSGHKLSTSSPLSENEREILQYIKEKLSHLKPGEQLEEHYTNYLLMLKEKYDLDL